MNPLCSSETADTLAEYIRIYKLRPSHDVDFWPTSGTDHVELRRPSSGSTGSPTWFCWNRMRGTADAMCRPPTTPLQIEAREQGSRAPSTRVGDIDEPSLLAERDELLSFASDKIAQSIMSLGAPSLPLREHFFALQIKNNDESDADHPTVRFSYRPYADQPPLLHSSMGSILLRLPGGTLEMSLTDEQATILHKSVKTASELCNSQTGKVDDTGFTMFSATQNEYEQFRRESRLRAADAASRSGH